MPQGALTSPPTYVVGSTNAAYVPISSRNNVGNSPDNFSIALPGFLAGVVSAEIMSSSAVNCEVVVEGEMGSGDYIPLWLQNPEKGPLLPAPNNDSYNEGGGQFLSGPRACGSARCWGYQSVRIRRIDQNGGTCTVWLNFREGAY